MPRRILLGQSLIAATCVAGVSLFATPGAYLTAGLLGLSAAVAVAVPTILAVRASSDAIRRLTFRVDQLAAGEFSGKVYVGVGGELRALAQSVNALSEATAGRLDQLERDRRRLAGILSGLVEGVVALDAEDRIVFANARAGSLLEFPPDRAVGRKFWEVVRQRTVDELVRDASMAQEPRRADIDWQSASPRSLAVYAAPLAGDATGMIVVIHDMTDLRRLEKLRQEFVANVSHELKTPLAVIKASAETLIDGAVEDVAYRRKFLDQIAEQSDRLHALILDLLALARIEGNAVPAEPAAVSVDEHVGAAVERHRIRAEAKQIELYQIAGPAVTAWAEEEAVEVMLDNLIDNAIKYTPEKGRITVKWGDQAGCTWLEVSDSGVGIPEADLPRIFERFYRVDKARSRELGGTGLGLAIVKHLAQTNGGSVSARSAVGKGSTFTIKLPAMPPGR
ncbi:MAG: PAS domain-containing protein [Gemmataceae bacterium]|nr:PAS domain-containing protein [Gemmataceae bacterium]